MKCTSVLIVGSLLSTIILWLPYKVQAQTDSGTSYYIDCAGNDTQGGTSTTTAWQTITKANTAPLTPGDNLLLRRGCTFDGSLTAAWNGTAGAPITIGAYGSGPLPVITFNAGGTTSSFVAVAVDGSYQVIENLATTVTNPVKNSQCLDASGQPIAKGWYGGFTITGHHNVIRNFEVSHMSFGVYTTDESSSNVIEHGTIHDLDTFWRLEEKLNDPMGAVGINLHGDDNEYAYNILQNNAASCIWQPDGSAKLYSAPFELFNANRAFVHHNKAFGHRKHFEMGRNIADPAKTADDNTLAYNLFVSDLPDAVGPNIHGDPATFGPVNNTQIYNNTIVLTGADSQALVCGCAGGATVKNNILIGEWKAAYYAGTVTETNNLYWDFGMTADAAADPFVQFAQGTISPTSFKLDPQFVSGTNYHLSVASPGIDTGVNVGYLLDLDHVSVPSNAVDIGAYEYLTDLPGDTNDDRLVDIFDYNTILNYFGQQIVNGKYQGDLDGNGFVDIYDYNTLLNYFGTRG